MTAQASAAPAPAPARESERTQVILKRLWGLHPKVIDLSLERIERLLARLGHPERKLPPVIHVAGTNGKGSAIAFMRAMLEAEGYRVHVYTSPHLVRVNERYRVAGRLIGDEELIAVLEECEAMNAGEPITYFEITTAAAFLAFSRTPAEAALIETGLGGRLDATNMVERPLMTAVTPVSVDHVQFLGGTLSEIAGEKAGILKHGVPAVIGRQPQAAAEVLARRGREVGAPLRRFGAEWDARATSQGFRWRGADGARDLPPPTLPGRHQVENAGLALACLENLPGLPVSEAAIRAGLASVEWPGRLQRLSRGPLVDRLPGGARGGSELWLDGGHNAGAGAALAEWAGARAAAPLHLVFGILNTKDPVAFLEPLARHARGLHAVAIPGEPASLSADESAAAARRAGLPAAPAASVLSAVASIAAEETGPVRILICGSLYLAGTVLAENG